jgi:hypothetical protein
LLAPAQAEATDVIRAVVAAAMETDAAASTVATVSTVVTVVTVAAVVNVAAVEVEGVGEKITYRGHL